MKRINHLCYVALLDLCVSPWAPGTLSCQAPSEPIVAPAVKEEVRFLAIGTNGQPITDLKPEELRVRIDKAERRTLSLTPVGDEPRTIGIFLDASGSRRDDPLKQPEVQWIGRFLESTWKGADEAFAVAFNTDVFVLSQPTKNRQSILGALASIRPEQYRGSTALYDALCFPKRRPDAPVKPEGIYVVLSDFEDNTSKHSEEKAISMLRDEDVRVFPLLVETEALAGKRVFHRAREAAFRFADKTGGDVLEAPSHRDLGKVFERLADELRPEYKIVYEGSAASGKAKRIQIETSRPHVRILYAKP